MQTLLTLLEIAGWVFSSLIVLAFTSTMIIFFSTLISKFIVHERHRRTGRGSTH